MIFACGSARLTQLPSANTEAMQKHFDEIGQRGAGRACDVLLDQAGWHTTDKLETPKNLMLLRILPASSELNAADIGQTQ